jgi:hypothetical protein
MRMEVVGLNDSEVKVGPVMVIIVGELCLPIALSVALTKRPTVPRVLPAVKITDAPDGVRVPMALLVRVQEYVVPEGQLPVHFGVAEKLAVPD